MNSPVLIGLALLGVYLFLFGARRLIKTGGRWGSTGTTDTPIELRLEEHLAKIKWPEHLEKQLRVLDGEVLITIPDFAFRKSRIAIFADGAAFHASREALYKDSLKRNNLSKNGWIVLVFWGSEIYQHPWRCVQTVQEAVASRNGIEWCSKCGGQGTYRHLGGCWACGGAGFKKKG